MARYFETCLKSDKLYVLLLYARSSVFFISERNHEENFDQLLSTFVKALILEIAGLRCMTAIFVIFAF